MTMGNMKIFHQLTLVTLNIGIGIKMKLKPIGTLEVCVFCMDVSFSDCVGSSTPERNDDQRRATKHKKDLFVCIVIFIFKKFR